MTDHTDEEQLKLIQSIDPLAVRVPPGVSKIIEHFNSLRQQDLARMARIREALEEMFSRIGHWFTVEQSDIWMKVVSELRNPAGQAEGKKCPHCDDGAKWRQDFDSPLCDKCNGSGYVQAEGKGEK